MKVLHAYIRFSLGGVAKSTDRINLYGKLIAPCMMGPFAPAS